MDNIEVRINKILANWNPINVPIELADEEYKNYVPIIIKNGYDKDLLFDCMCNTTRSIVGLNFDLTNKSHLKDLQEVCNEIFNVISQSHS